MKKVGPFELGRVMGFDTLREWILEVGLTEDDTIILHPANFDALAEEHRALYAKPLPEPYFLLGVFVDEAKPSEMPCDWIIIIQDDDRPVRTAIREAEEANKDDGRTIYRCGWCGNIVDERGGLVSEGERSRLISWLGERGSHRNERAVNGACCPNGHREK